MNVIKAKSDSEEWNVDLANLARIWKGGCIIRAGFLDRIKSAYLQNPKLDSLLVDEGFAKDLVRSMTACPSSLVAHFVMAGFIRVDVRCRSRGMMRGRPLSKWLWMQGLRCPAFHLP
jgi:6-phosphogluconate dehydrogenase